jgi:hypothetical protein
VNDTRKRHIAAQALKAVNLRRQFECGDLTHQEYVASRNARQIHPTPIGEQASLASVDIDSKPGSTSRQMVNEPCPERFGALRALQLRGRLDNGQLTQHEYLAQLNTYANNTPVATRSGGALQPLNPKGRKGGSTG